jgi:hypothetical protein
MSLRPSRTRSWPLLCAALSLSAFLVVALAPRMAAAQSLAIQLKTSLVRRDSTGAQVTKDQSLQPYGINLQDCRAGQSVEFSLVMSGYLAGDVVEVWASDAGGDCSVPTARTGGTQTCYKLNAVVPLTPSPTVRVPVKEIIAGRDPALLDVDGCRRLRSKTAIDVQFLLFRGGNTGNATTKDAVSINVKTLGPTSLTGIKALPGDTRITVSWNQVGEGGVDDVIGVRAYCDVNPAAGSGSTSTTVCEDGGLDEAGIPIDAGCTTTTTSTGTGTIPTPDDTGGNGTLCSTAAFSAAGDGGRVVPDSTFAQYQCGSVSGVTGNTIVAESAGGAPLPNGKVIAVAIAGTDSFGNVGELSDAICQFPETTTDFWKDYKDSGGAAGGCDVTGGATSAASTCLLGIAVALSGSMLRRLRTKRKDR